MNRKARFLVGALLGSGLVITAAPPLGVMAMPHHQEYREIDGIRGLVDRTQSDLRAAEDMDPRNSKERDRYRNAQKNLSDLDRHLTKGKFDRGELDRSIGDIQNILDHNTLQASSRDALLRDVADLRQMRERNRH